MTECGRAVGPVVVSPFSLLTNDKTSGLHVERVMDTSANRLYMSFFVLFFSFCPSVDNLAYQKPVASSRVVNHYRPDLIVDGNAGSCIYLDTRVDDRFIQIDLGRNHLITGLLLHVPDGTSFEQHCLNVIIIPGSLVNRLRPGTDRFHSREIGIRPGHPVSQVNCCTHCCQ